MPRKANNRKPKGKKEEDRDFFCRVEDAFRVAARKISAVLGTAWAFMGAVAIIVIWGATGHIFHYSDTWQLIINTATTIVTFLMVLIQNHPEPRLPRDPAQARRSDPQPGRRAQQADGPGRAFRRGPR